MVIVALAYGVIASGLMLWVGAPLVGFVGRKNEAEGYFRFAMMRIRDNAESVALMNGARYEQAVLGRFYETVVARWMAIVWQHGHLTWITNSSGPMIPIVPLLFAAPKYISGELTLGQVTQLAAAFIQVQIAISWVVDNYNRVAEWYASARRVMDIVDACDAIDPHIDAIAADADAGAGRAGRQRALRRFRDRRRQRPAAAVGRRPLRRPRRGRAHPRRFQHRQVDAGAGAGRPVVGRARQPGAARPVAGDDHAAEELPAARLAQGRAALSQTRRCRCPTTASRRRLAKVGLEALGPRLDERARWDQVLSNGERQRLAIARLIIHQPRVVILDDALSALEESAQAAVLARLRTELAGATIISLGQRPAPSGAHERELRLERRGDHAVLLPGGAPVLATAK